MMFRLRGVVFVLWADLFDEAAAAIFVTEFRRAGLRVQLVSLTSHRVMGAHGLGLLPDLTLEQALSQAGHAICVVVPCGLAGAQRLHNDPRLQEFFDQARANRATLVVGQAIEDHLADLALFAPSLDDVTIYPDGQELIDCAHQTAVSLSAAPQGAGA